MGTWDSGLLDNDGALDTLGDISASVYKDVLAVSSSAPGEQAAAWLGAAVGVLLQLSPYDFQEPERAAPIKEAIDAHRDTLDLIGPEAAALLGSIADGQGAELAQRSGDRSGELERALGGYIDHVREPALFAHPMALSYVQEVAERCAEVLEEGLSGGAPDLYEMDCLGALGVLLILEPWTLPAERIARWRQAFESAWERTRAGGGSDLGFWEEYVPRARLAIDLTQRRSVRA